MNRTAIMYIALSTLAMGAIGAAFAFLYLQHPLYALGSSLTATVLTKGRIMLGGRVKRTPIFKLHLSLAIPSFLFLAYAAFFPVAPRAMTLLLFLYALTFITGIPPWLEGIRTMLARHTKA